MSFENICTYNDNNRNFKQNKARWNEIGTLILGYE